MKDQSVFIAGHDAGVNADQPMDAFTMSQYTEDFKLGYVVALAEVHSVRCANAVAAGVEAAEMGQKYGVAYHSLAPYFVDPDNHDVLDALRSGYGLEDGEEDEEKDNNE